MVQISTARNKHFGHADTADIAELFFLIYVYFRYLYVALLQVEKAPLVKREIPTAQYMQL